MPTNDKYATTLFCHRIVYKLIMRPKYPRSNIQLLAKVLLVIQRTNDIDAFKQMPELLFYSVSTIFE